MATLVQAVRMALHYGEEHLGVTDIFGEDVGPPLGGVFTATQGLRTAWNSPLDERGIIGTAMGVALFGAVSSGGACTIAFSAIMAVISFVCSLPRTFGTLSKIAAISALTTFISVILATIFAGIEDHPGPNWPSKGIKPQILAVPLAGTSFVAGMNAFMNISYTFIGQITIPSFVCPPYARI